MHPDLLTLAGTMLELAAAAFARNSSNDYTLPDLAPKAREQIAALVAAGRGTDEERDDAEDFGPGEIVADWQIMLALARGLATSGKLEAEVADRIADLQRVALAWQMEIAEMRGRPELLSEVEVADVAILKARLKDRDAAIARLEADAASARTTAERHVAEIRAIAQGEHDPGISPRAAMDAKLREIYESQDVDESLDE